MSASPAPTVVLVHGAFADASSWSAVHAALKEDGLSVVAPPNPLRGLASDAAYVQAVVERIDGPVILVGHSYGGAVIGIAGNADNVVGLVFVAAYALEENESLGELQGGFPDSKLAANIVPGSYPVAGAADGTEVTIAPAAFPEVFAADLPREQTEFLAIAQRPLATAAFEERSPAPAWKTTPSWGLVAAADNAINPDVERHGYSRAGMTTVEIAGASHAVALSRPDAVADLIRQAVATTTTTTDGAKVTLEPAAQAFADANANPPFLTDLGPEKGRAVLDEVQSGPGVDRPDAEIEEFTIEAGPTGAVKLKLFKPVGASTSEPLPVILYLHGAGWVFGSPVSHDRLVRELMAGTGAAVVFPDYDRTPEAKYPIANEQAFATAEWIAHEGASRGLDADRIVVAGDSCGGNMAIAVTLMAKARKGPRFAAQALFYPVTDASFDTPSYRQFAEGYHLRRDMMRQFWDWYTTSEQERAEITASPRRATPELLAGLPPALVINAEADVLRDEGEGYAELLREAGVDVEATRYEAVIHDFMMLDATRETHAAKAATAEAIAFISKHLA